MLTKVPRIFFVVYQFSDKTKSDEKIESGCFQIFKRAFGAKDRRRQRRRTSAGGHVEAQPVAAGDVRDAELLDDPGGDGALAGRRGAQYDGPEGRRGGGGATRGERYHGKAAVYEADDFLRSAATATMTTSVRVPRRSRIARVGLYPRSLLLSPRILIRARAAIRPRLIVAALPATRRDAP